MRIELEPSFILHSRSYRETSMLVYALTEQHGVVHMISRGAKKKGNNFLQPFVRMHLSWSGRGDLVSLTKTELEYSKYTRNFRAQLQCLYLHELILRLMPKMSPAPELFHLYEHTLNSMIESPLREDLLRVFELQLLNIIGHPLQLKFDYKNDREIQQDLFYRYDPDLGPVQCVVRSSQWNIVSGALLQSLDKHELDKQNLPAAKVFLRGLMQHYLCGKPLMTRQLLRVGN